MTRQTPPHPFTTDGCSGGMTWAWKKIYGRDPPWQGACVEHDAAYWAGGTRGQRVLADIQLCLAVARTGHPNFAIFMLLAVWYGGHPWLPLPWRWGYGWPYPRGYER